MHPPEPAYPCYLPVLGEFNRMTPHEGPSASLPDDSVCPELGRFRCVSVAGHAHFLRTGTGGPGLCETMSGPARVAWSMSGGGADGCGTCPFLARRVGLRGNMSSLGRVRGACSVAGRPAGGGMSIFPGLFVTRSAPRFGLCPALDTGTGHVPEVPSARVERAQLGEAGKFR